MADNAPMHESTSNEGNGEANGDRNQRTSDSNSRGRGRDRNSGGRGQGRGQSRGRGGRKGFGSKNPSDRHSRGEMGRGEFYSRGGIDKRKRNDEEQAAKRRKVEDGDAESSNLFTKEEIEGEARKPKRKVAVMIGYAGTGYKGMQINDQEKTIEGDLFKAFIAAGAISKANADDSKKSSLVRCARTDKGVHAAGNVISLKLIVEDPDIVKTINENLPPQIRVWGFERTNGAFSCYQACDSRWYEYLIPTYSFLPPHPLSFLGKQLEESAEKEGIYETYKSLQQDVVSFWTSAEETYVKPILDKLDPELREQVLAAIHREESEQMPESNDSVVKRDAEADEGKEAEAATKGEVDTDLIMEKPEAKIKTDIGSEAGDKSTLNEKPETDMVTTKAGEAEDTIMENNSPASVQTARKLTPFESAIKEVKAAYITAKKAYRISDFRRKRIEEALQCYIGTRNFHNYTIQKSYSDPSAKRVIRSFKVGPNPVYINDTEWLSLKVHGQSFMMHQIRKMVAMAALVVRCGARLQTITDSYGSQRISIPKAPGLGLLLERPVFDSYNERAVKEFKREKIDFEKYQKEIDKFKQREIYDRIFREEEKDHQFHTFFHHIDHYRTEFFLWVTASGVVASKVGPAKGESKKIKDESDEEEADANGEEG